MSGEIMMNFKPFPNKTLLAKCNILRMKTE